MMRYFFGLIVAIHCLTLGATDVRFPMRGTVVTPEPVPWGHAVTDLVLKDLYPQKRATDEARYGVEFLNSWAATWGNGGFAIRTGSKMYADAIYALLQVIV